MTASILLVSCACYSVVLRTRRKRARCGLTSTRERLNRTARDAQLCWDMHAHTSLPLSFKGKRQGMGQRERSSEATQM